MRGNEERKELELLEVGGRKPSSQKGMRRGGRRRKEEEGEGGGRRKEDEEGGGPERIWSGRIAKCCREGTRTESRKFTRYISLPVDRMYNLDHHYQ